MNQKGNATPIAATESNRAVSPETAWSLRFEELARYAERLGRIRRSPAECNPALLAWITNQRRSHNLSSEKRGKLEELPGWSFDPRMAAWEHRAEQLRQFIIRARRTPRVRAQDNDERALAHWYARQRRAAERLQLPDDRVGIYVYVTRAITLTGNDGGPGA